MLVKCPVCGRYQHRDSENAFFSNGYYYHRDCYLGSSEKEKLILFIKGFYGLPELPDKINSQIGNFMSSNSNLSYKDIQDSLIYFYQIKGNPIREKDSIGIVPLVYMEARNQNLVTNIYAASLRKGLRKIAGKAKEPVRIIAPKKERKFYNIEDLDNRSDDKDAMGQECSNARSRKPN